LSGRGLFDELITRPEESYRLWCVVVCDLETSRIGAPYVYDISNLRVKPKHKEIHSIWNSGTYAMNEGCSYSILAANTLTCFRQFFFSGC